MDISSHSDAVFASSAPLQLLNTSGSPNKKSRDVVVTIATLDLYASHSDSHYQQSLNLDHTKHYCDSVNISAYSHSTPSLLLVKSVSILKDIVDCDD